MIRSLAASHFNPAFSAKRAPSRVLPTTYADNTPMTAVDQNTLRFLSDLFQNTPYPFQQWLQQKKYIPQTLKALRDAVQTKLEETTRSTNSEKKIRGTEGRTNAVFLHYGLSADHLPPKNDTEIGTIMSLSSHSINTHRKTALNMLRASLNKSLRPAFTEAGFDMTHLAGPDPS